MLTDFARDGLFSAMWFGLMAVVWFGWAQEDPPRRWRPWLGVGSTVGILMAIGFGIQVATRWGEATALEGRYPWFGALVAAELIAAGVGCGVLHRRGANRWFAWWVALVVAAHFVPLALLLEDFSLAAVGALLLAGLVLLRPRLRSMTGTTSRLVGVLMGSGLLTASLIAGARSLLG